MTSRPMWIGSRRLPQQDQPTTYDERDGKERLQELIRG